MSLRLAPYPAYKDSGVPWLGTVPTHWSTTRFKNVVRNVVEQTSTQEPGDSYIALEHVESWTGRVLPKNVEFSGAVKRFMKDDVLFGKLRPYLAKVTRPDHPGVCVGEFLVLRTTASDARPDFIERTIRSAPFIQLVNSATFGAKMPRAEWSVIGEVLVPRPEPAEQAAIARFLDHADRRISRLIRAKRRLIELLNEQKQAITHRAVTRGLDPNVRLKPSGIDWLGDVSEGWEAKKLKFVTHAIGGMTPSKAMATYWVGDVPWVSPKDMKTPEIADSIDHISRSALEDTGIAMIEAGAVLIVVRGMILARRLPVAVTTTQVTVNQDMKALITDPSIVTPHYLRYVLTGIQDYILSNLVEEAGHGTRCLRTDEWSNLALPLPPVCEQYAIVDTLDRELCLLNSSVESASREIELLREYRTRLIADVVTGKLDVRGVELPPLDDDGALDNIAAGDDADADATDDAGEDDE